MLPVETTDQVDAERQPSSGRFSLRTLCLAVTTCAMACAMLSWASVRPLVVPLAVAVPLYWCGLFCMSFSSRRRVDYHPLTLLGCVLLSTAVMLGVLGPLFVLLLWLLSLVHEPVVTAL